MCLTSVRRSMGCGKSHHNSPGHSETDLTNNSCSNRIISLNKDTSKIGQKKKLDDVNDKNCIDNERYEKPSSSRNGKTNSQDTQVSPSISSCIRTSTTSSSCVKNNKSNGATKPHSTYYLLEVPSDVFTTEVTSRTSKNVKSLPTPKEFTLQPANLISSKCWMIKLKWGMITPHPMRRQRCAQSMKQANTDQKGQP